MSNSTLTLRALTVENLATYVAKQLDSLFPEDGMECDVEILMPFMPNALGRIIPILSEVRAFSPGSFDHFHSLQYSTFLYLLANECWRSNIDNTIADRLCCLNRALNSIDLFYKVEMPELFFISHGLGLVLGRATYANRLVLFQNVTVGRVGDDRPTIEEGVVIYPGSSVTGKAFIGEGSVVSAGVQLHGISVPPNSLVVSGPGGVLVKDRRKNYLALYFRTRNE